MPWNIARCQTPCARFIASDDPHSKCVKCLGFSHARKAVYGISKCTFCENLHLRTLRSQLEVFEKESSVFPHRAPEAILQAYQADVLQEMDKGTGLTPEAVKELRRATDLALRAIKHTACAVGRSMAGSVAAERHLWLNLTEIREKEKVFLLDAPISQSGLFGEAVSSVVEKFRSAKTQSAALKQFMPRRTRDHSTPSSSLSREQSLPRKEPSGRSGAQAAHPPPTTVWGAHGQPFSHQRPRRQVDLKRPSRPAASAESSLTLESG